MRLNHGTHISKFSLAVYVVCSVLLSWRVCIAHTRHAKTDKANATRNSMHSAWLLIILKLQYLLLYRCVCW